MLKKIRFKNYKSFMKETVISLEKNKLSILEETNTKHGILRGCAFYGSNASVKTTALNAISILLDLLFLNGSVDMNSRITLFNNEKTAFFEYSFEFGVDEIVYYFELARRGRFVKETLDLDGKNCLTRLLNSAESFITENRMYGKDDIDEHTLFIRNIYFNTKFMAYPVLKKWFEFLSKSIFTNLAQCRTHAYGLRLEELILPTYLETHGDEEINAFLKAFNFPYTVKYEKESNTALGNSSFDSRLTFVRKDLPPVQFSMESYGNHVLLSLLPAVISAMKNESMLIIDEFSSGLHNELEELLIKYIFNNSDCKMFFISNTKN